MKKIKYFLAAYSLESDELVENYPVSDEMLKVCARHFRVGVDVVKMDDTLRHTFEQHQYRFNPAPGLEWQLERYADCAEKYFSRARV